MARPKTDFFIYEILFPALAPAANTPQTLVFDAASDFIWYYAAFSANNIAALTGYTAATRYAPPITVLMVPGDTSSQFMSSAAPLTHMFGNGENPFVLPAPRLIPARTTLTVTANNQDTAITYNLYLSLIGTKRYLN
jgi:hypothetical protein